MTEDRAVGPLVSAVAGSACQVDTAVLDPPPNAFELVIVAHSTEQRIWTISYSRVT